MIITMMRLNGVRSIFNQLSSTILFILFLIFSPFTFADDLKPFTTDGCSSFPDGTFEQQSLWAQCCIQHDLAYWQGGSHSDRLNSDQQLAHCVAKVGEPEIAKLMLTGVRVGGTPYLPTSFRWGYGWSWPRGYKVLNQEEQSQVKRNLKNLELMLKTLSNKLKTEIN